MPKHVISFHPKNQGFTLLEVLVTLLIVSIGFLGLAGLQVTGLRSNLSADARGQASLMVNDIIERMRANPLGVQNSTASEDNAYAAINSAAITCNSLPDPFCSNYNDGTATNAANCTPKQMATFDAWVWYCGMPVASGGRAGGIRNWLVNGSATVSCVDNDNTDGDACTEGSSYQITVNWQEASTDRNNPGTVTQTITTIPTSRPYPGGDHGGTDPGCINSWRHYPNQHLQQGIATTAK